MVFKMSRGRSPDRVEKGCFDCPEVLRQGYFWLRRDSVQISRFFATLWVLSVPSSTWHHHFAVAVASPGIYSDQKYTINNDRKKGGGKFVNEDSKIQVAVLFIDVWAKIKALLKVLLPPQALVHPPKTQPRPSRPHTPGCKPARLVESDSSCNLMASLRDLLLQHGYTCFANNQGERCLPCLPSTDDDLKRPSAYLSVMIVGRAKL